MDGELGERLQAILSDPAQMEKLSEMAKGLFGQTAGDETRGETAAEADKPPAADAPETKFLSAIGKAFAAGNKEKSRSTALLLAMRPYMRPEKQEKLDRALQIARMAHIAGAVMREYGGDSHGL